MNINHSMQICLKNKVKVFPEYFHNLKGYKIGYKIGNEKPKYFDKIIKQKEINNALTSSYIYLASKL